MVSRFPHDYFKSKYSYALKNTHWDIFKSISFHFVFLFCISAAHNFKKILERTETRPDGMKFLSINMRERERETYRPKSVVTTFGLNFLRVRSKNPLLKAKVYTKKGEIFVRQYNKRQVIEKKKCNIHVLDEIHHISNQF